MLLVDKLYSGFQSCAYTWCSEKQLCMRTVFQVVCSILDRTFSNKSKNFVTKRSTRIDLQFQLHCQMVMAMAYLPFAMWCRDGHSLTSASKAWLHPQMNCWKNISFKLWNISRKPTYSVLKETELSNSHPTCRSFETLTNALRKVRNKAKVVGNGSRSWV